MHLIIPEGLRYQKIFSIIEIKLKILRIPLSLSTTVPAMLSYNKGQTIFRTAIRGMA
jgi:hypothetical protein